MGAQLEAMDPPKFVGGGDNNEDAAAAAAAFMNNKRVALVTGSGAGIGANIAVDLARDGFFVVVTGRNIARLNKVVQQCNEAAAAAALVSETPTADHSASTSAHDTTTGAPVANKAALVSAAVAFVADLLDLKQVDQLIDFVRVKFNRLDVLVNNACWRDSTGGSMLAHADHETTTKLDDFKKVMHINVSVPMYLISKCLIPLKIKGSSSELSAAQSEPSLPTPPPPSSSSLLSSDGDRPAIVINISSSASKVVVPLHFYSISKACLSELSRQVAVAAQTCGILSVTISPGPVLTDDRPHHAAMSNLTLMNRVGTTQEVSNLVLFAIAHAHLLNGQELFVDGGYTVKGIR